ncbi:MAG TPA: SWIM zinc finger family protein [Ktedonobacteraceae bacterium]
MSDWRPRYFEWDYYSESQPRKVDKGIKTKSERGAIGASWWSKRWVHALESLGMGTRLTRGRSYARMGQVLSIDVQSGLVKARVQGSLREPYKIDIRLQPFSDADWVRVMEAMAAQAVFAAKLLAGEMPTNIEDAFESVNLSLFPTTEKDLQTNCSCPDWANPCKHIAAVYYILAEHFDGDPFLIFKLRGRSKDELLAVLREKRTAILPVTDSASTALVTVNDTQQEALLRLEDYASTFWQTGEELDTFAVHLQNATVDKAILKRLGDAPFLLGHENITSVLSSAYDVVHTATVGKIEEIQSDIEL